MKFKTILLLILLLNAGFCSYWNVDNDPATTQTLEEQYNEETEQQIMQSSGIGQDFLIAVAKPFNSVRAFFTTMNNWVGEAIFVLRVIGWFSLIMLVQIVFVLFWVYFAKITIRVVSAIVVIMDSDNVIGTIKDKHGNTVRKTKNKLYNTLSLLKSII